MGIKYRAEPFDLMQRFYLSAHDSVIRAQVRFSGRVDLSALKRAVGLSGAAVPQIFFRFDEEKHCWEDRGLTAEDVVAVVDAPEEEDAAAEQCLLSTIAFFSGPQLRVFLVRGAAADTLCVVLSHLVSDGVGLKQYLYLLSDLYSKCLADPDFAERPPLMDRSLRGNLRRFKRKEKMQIYSTPMDYPEQDPSMFLPFEKGIGDPERLPQEPFRIRREIGAAELLRMKAYAKARSATVNDLLLAAFARAYHALTGNPKLYLPCPVDLRKYAPDPENCGICNLAGNYTCEMEMRDGEPFDVTLLSVMLQMKLQKNSLGCLKGPMLLNLLAFRLPYPLSEKLFFKSFTIPVTSYTNLGVLDRERLRFGGVEAMDACLSTSVRHAPNFQVSVSTFDNRCTLSISGDYPEQGRRLTEAFLSKMAEELESLRPAE